MSAPWRVSVVIPTYQRCASVQRLLSALARQTFSPEAYEVIVSIDGSGDGTQEMVAQFRAPYSLRALWQPHRGRASAVNAGIRAATGDLLVVLDDDMQPVPEFLAAHQRAHQGDSEVGVLGAVPICFNSSSSPVVQFIGSKFNQHLEKLLQPGYRFMLRDFYTGNFSIRREVLLRVGPFDEDFKDYGNEDLELFVRLTNAGIPLIFSAEALAYQHYEKDLAALAKDKIAAGRTAVLLASKHAGTLDSLRLSTYGQSSLKWRLLRGILLGIGHVWNGMPRLIIAFVSALARIRPSWFQLVCPAALDYFYWEGAFSAIQENRRKGQGLTALPKLANPCKRRLAT